MTVGAILVITAVIVLIVLAFVPYVPDIIAGIQAGLTKAQANLAASGVSTTELSGVEAQAQAWLSDHISAIVGAVGTAVTIAILGGILLFFLLQDGDKAWVWCLQAMGDWQRERITSSGDDALQRVGGYLRGTALLAGAHAATDLVFLILLGVPLPAPLAVLVFFGGFIPYVGGLVTSLVVLGVAYAAIGAQGTFILLVLIVITNVILNNIVRPVVYGKTVHIHPAVVLIALPAGAAVAGVVGLFVAIPVVAFVTAVWGSVVAILEPEENPVAEIGIVPGWLDRVAQWSWRLLIGAALLAFAIWLAVMLPLVVMPVVLAVVLAATFAPMAGALLRRGWGRGRAALTVTAGAFLIITGIMVLTVGGPRGAAPTDRRAGRRRCHEDRHGHEWRAEQPDVDDRRGDRGGRRCRQVIFVGDRRAGDRARAGHALDVLLPARRRRRLGQLASSAWRAGAGPRSTLPADALRASSAGT